MDNGPCDDVELVETSSLVEEALLPEVLIGFSPVLSLTRSVAHF